MQERQVRLEAEAERSASVALVDFNLIALYLFVLIRRFSSSMGMSKDEQERRQLYKEVLEYEHDSV